MTKLHPTVLLICGSHRHESMTRKAMHVLAKNLEHQGIHCEIFDPAASEPMQIGTLITQNNTYLLHQLVHKSAAVVLCTPEYNGSYSALIKSIIELLDYPSILKGKPTALLGVAAGALGAVKALEHLQSVCLHNGAIVLPPYVSIPLVNQHFDHEGHCINGKTAQLLDNMAKMLKDYLKA